MIDFVALAQAGVRGLRAYDPGHDLVALRRQHAPAPLVELGSNENPYGASPKARQAVVDALEGLHIYPDPVRILLTGYADIKAVIEAINKGKIFHYLSKPWNEKELTDTIEKSYELYNARKNDINYSKELETSNNQLEFMLRQQLLS